MFEPAPPAVLAGPVDPAFRFALQGATDIAPSSDRRGWWESQARGRRVVHVGCADHPDLIDDKAAEGSWLHARIAAASAASVGFDINPHGVEAAQAVASDPIILHDLCAASHEVLAEGWDLLALPDVLEHVGDPVRFLAGLGTRNGEHVSRLVLSVPNALRKRNWRSIRGGTEVINSDHRHWYTPFTLCRVLHDAGWVCEGIDFVDDGGRWLGRPSQWGDWLHSRRYPQQRDTIVAYAHWPRD